jgi:hypothetical protein
MDEGKPLGHGPAFKRRAIQLMKRDRQLDVMSIIELQQCTQPEEPEWIPHRTEYKNVPLPDVAADISKRLSNAVLLAAKALPANLRWRIYRELDEAKRMFYCYHGAVERGDDHLVRIEERRRSGPRGKPLRELLSESKTLNLQIAQCHERLSAVDNSARHEMQRLYSRFRR